MNPAVRIHTAPTPGLTTTLVLAATVAPATIDLFLPALPQVRADLLGNAGGVELSVSAFLLGMALGQLVIGPWSDMVGRRVPFLVSVGGYVAASIVAALAPNFMALVLARFAQGVFGSGGLVVGRAIVADLHQGMAAARMYTQLMTASTLAPVLAPVVGGLLAPVAGWRGLLGLLAVAGAMVLLLAFRTLPTGSPSGAKLRRPDLGTLAHNREFLRWTTVFALGFAALMTYVSSSSMVYQEVLGLGPRAYASCFALNAAAMAAVGLIGRRHLNRWPPRRQATVLLRIHLLCAAAFAVLAIAGAPEPTYAVALFGAVAATGGVFGNLAALAIGSLDRAVGAGSAVLGCAQFGSAGLLSPIGALVTPASVVGPAVAMTVCGLAAVVGASYRRNH